MRNLLSTITQDLVENIFQIHLSGGLIYQVYLFCCLGNGKTDVHINLYVFYIWAMWQ